jgi:hypothetical protein
VTVAGKGGDGEVVVFLQAKESAIEIAGIAAPAPIAKLEALCRE